MSTTATINDILEAIGEDQSDYESSEDEYMPTQQEIRDAEVEMEEVPCASESKMLTKKRKRRGSWEDDDDLPLANLRSELWGDEDDIPLSRLVTLNGVNSEDEDLDELLEMPIWTDCPFNPPDATFTGSLEASPQDGNLKTPYQFFKDLITDDMLDYLESQTNIYSLQKEGIQLKTTTKEIETFIGVYLRMGLVQAFSVRAFWEAETRHPPVADVMARERFQKLAVSLHFTNNLTVTDNDKKDKVWKIRPWIKKLQQQLEKIPPEEHQSVDEIMVAFKGQSTLKQYIRNKPHKWGFKMWGRCSTSGILHDFDIYQGASPQRQEKSPYGVGGDVVLKMTAKLEEGKNYKIFADNFFTNLPLIKALKERSLVFVGTVRVNRLKGCRLSAEADLKHQGRGSSDTKVEINSNVVAVRWYDNKSVDLVSSYKGVYPQAEVRRWSKKDRLFITVQCPDIVREYNTYMGGVDLLDMLTSLYKFPIKSRRWYLYIFYHTISIAVVTAWLWYKRHCQLLQQQPMRLSTFQSKVAEALISTKRPVGRPSSMSPPPHLPPKPVQRAPVSDVRYDNIDHLPQWGTRGRCKYGGCTSLSFLKCIKCNVQLCLNKDRNCFFYFHKK